MLKPEETYINEIDGYAEGAHAICPTEDKISKYLEDKGYIVSNLDIIHDKLMNLYRWTCNISKYK
jgi:hypothetical protein